VECGRYLLLYQEDIAEFAHVCEAGLQLGQRLLATVIRVKSLMGQKEVVINFIRSKLCSSRSSFRL
jgi:hypothetical protein